MKEIVEKLKELKSILDTNQNETLDSIIKEAESKIPSDRDKEIEALGHYISEDDVEEAYDKLLKQAEIDGSVMADDVILMWCNTEYTYTVDQLLDMI